MLSRLLLVTAPFLAAVTAIFAAFALYSAALSAMRGSVGFALFNAAFGIGGLALAMALWQTWRRARASRRG